MPRVLRPWLVLPLAVLVLGGVAAVSAAAASGDAAQVPADNTPVVLIVMENFGDASIVGSPNAPYINAAGPFGCSGPQPGLMCGESFTNFSNPEPAGTGPDGNPYPSLPAYVELTSADLSAFTAANCGGSLAKPDSCFKDSSGAVVPSGNPQENLFDQLQSSGLPNPWGGYAEGMNRNCQLTGNAVSSTGGYYATRHFPPVYYGDLTGACANRAVPYISGSAPDPSNLPQFSFVAPDTCSDMHDASGCVVPTGPTDCTGKTGAALQQCIGDDWLANNVPPLLSHALVLVTWDEDHQEPGNANRVLLTMDGVGAETGVQHTEPYTFDGLLHGLENYWGLPCIPGDGVSLYGHTPGSCSATPVPLPSAVGPSPTTSPSPTESPSPSLTESPSSTPTVSPSPTSSSSAPSIRVVQHALCRGKSTAPTCAWPAPTTPGDLLVAALGVAGKPAITAPTGYSTAVTSARATAIASRASTGDGGNVAFSLSTGRAWVMDLVDVQGVSASPPPDVTATYTSGSTVVTSVRSGATPPTTAASGFAIAVLYDASSLPGSSLTPGFTWVDAGTQATRNWTGFASTVTSSGGALEASATLSSAAQARGCIAVFPGA